MTNIFKNGAMGTVTIKAFAFLFNIAAIAISAVLTYQFCAEITSASGAPVVLAWSGVLLDLVKSLCAFAAMRLIVSGRVCESFSSLSATVIPMFFAISMSALSAVASIYSLESGVNAIQQQDAKYQQALSNLDSKIDSLESERQSLKSLAKQQLDANQITNSSKTMSAVREISSDIEQTKLQKQTLKPSPSNSVLEFKNTITITIAVALELVTYVLACVLAVMNKPSIKNTLTDTPVNTGTYSVNSKSKRIMQHRPVNVIEDSEPVFVARVFESGEYSESNIALSDVRAAIVSGCVRPTHRQLKEYFKLKQTQISDIQKLLVADGTLIQTGNSYQVA